MSLTGNSPGNLKDEEFYDAAPLEPHLLYQGEILTETPIFYMSKETRWLLVRTGSGASIEAALKNGNLGGTVKVLDSNQSKVQWQQNEGDYAIGKLSKKPVVVLSQTCDTQNKKSIQVAPIFPVPNEKYTDRLKAGDIFDAFYIKAHPPEIETDCYADFGLIQSVHKSYIKGIKPEHHFRLCASKTLDLQRSITRFFGRPNSFDAGTDKAPRNGTYMCIRCFYWDGVVSEISRSQGEDFPGCEKCTGEQWVPKLGSMS